MSWEPRATLRQAEAVTVPHTGADPQQSSRRSRAGLALARSTTQRLFCFKLEQHCLLASSVASEIQHLMDDGGQKRDLSHIKISSISSTGPQIGSLHRLLTCWTPLTLI